MEIKIAPAVMRHFELNEPFNDNMTCFTKKIVSMVADTCHSRSSPKNPSADVVEVVRCSECVMHEKGCPLDTHPYMTPDDGYCYKGKRKDDK